VECAASVRALVRTVLGPARAQEGQIMVFRGIDLPMERLGDLCRRHHIRRLALFGSILTDEFRPDSDVDVLVEFEPGKIPGLEYFGIEAELSDLIGRRVDLNSPGFLSRYFRDEIVREARTIYAAEE